MISTLDWLSRRIRPNPSPYELSQSERYARYRELGVVYEIPPFSDPRREAEYQRHAPERARVRWL